MCVLGDVEVSAAAYRIGRVIVADGRHDQRLAAEHLQVVGDVAGTAAEFAPHVGHQEGDVEDVDLVGQDVVAEAVVEHHDGVVGDRAADQCAHGRNPDKSGAIIASGT